MILDVEFEESPLEEYVAGLSGKRASSAKLLTLADGEEELETAFEQLNRQGSGVDISDLPAYADHSRMAQRLQLEKKLEKIADLTGQLPEGDPLRLYLEELAAIPVCGDVQVLALEMAGGRQVQEQLLNLSLSRVVELALEYTGHGVLLMDLIQEGSMGLWAAMSDYTGGDFAAFRDEKLRFAMEKAVVMQAHAAGLGQKMRQAVEDYRATDERLLTELGRNPTMEEIAEALHMEPAEVATVAAMLDNARTMNRVTPPEPEEQPQEDDQAVEDTAYFQQRQRILEMLSTLTEQESRLLVLRYGLEGGKPMTATEAGAKLGLSAQETVALEASALEKLRKQ